VTLHLTRRRRGGQRAAEPARETAGALVDA
jgi:hypothetical protein